ncbi:MAG: hypothetical protein HY019_00825 [Aquabacterium sp.]|uniref:beta strand repeat-containing protein n=1 Tax=Aquabacterium sp. TaxID=1872578 RepID=UPI0025C718D1|nr:calcium-binding protein [Aquabacterium sp.]MBI3380523.1 hypothetical protein [Aquabacterium sp.]
MVITGGSGDDKLIGTTGDDTLDGGVGVDTLTGDTGNDTYLVDNTGDVVQEYNGLNDGVDTVISTVDYTLPGSVENLTVQAMTNLYTYRPITVGGNDQDNVLIGQSAKQTGLYTIYGPHGTSQLGGYYFFDSHAMSGGGGNDKLIAGDGNDTLDGGSGADTMSGGAGADVYYIDNAGDRIEGEGAAQDWQYSSSFYTYSDVDQVFSSVDYSLGDYLENLTLTGAALSATGNDMGNVLTGTDQGNTLSGMAGNDTLLAGLGDDTLVGGIGNDVLSGEAGADTYRFAAGDGQDLIHADAADTITLAADLNRADLHVAWAANGEAKLVLQLNATGDSITLDQIDQWQSGLAVNWASGGSLSGADLLALAQPAPIIGTDGADSLTGLAANDQITALGGNDTLNGGFGADTMAGGLGDDVYYVDQAGDKVNEDADQGTDTIISSAANWALTANVENLTVATPGSTGTGNDKANVLIVQDQGPSANGSTLYGLEGNDSLEAHGRDTLYGGVGNDVYDIYAGYEVYYDPYTGSHPTQFIRESVMENAAEGTDEIRLHGILSAWFTGGSYVLPDNVEHLTLVNDGMALPTVEGNDLANRITGNDLANTMYGGAGNDTLFGGAGGDYLRGGLGNDELTGGDGVDTFNFARGDGQDLIHADATDTIALDASIVRGDLVFGKLGASGADTLTIGIKGSTDSITLDHVSQLDALVVNFGADGSSATLGQLRTSLNLTGTAGKDTLTGGVGDDTLTGLAGNDVLAGGKGKDLLVGGKGNDTYLFNRGDGQDTIVDTDSTWFNADLLKVGDAKSNQLWFTRSGNNLDISIIGTTDTATIQDWFVSSANRVEKITALGDGKSLSAAKVNNLVNAMASFTPSAMASTTLPADTPASITKLIASSWA